MDSQAAYEQRQEIPFLDRVTSIGRIKDLRLLQRLVDYLNTLKQRTGVEQVVGEWCGHKGFEVVPVGHGVYGSDSAAALRRNYSRGDPFFSFFPVSYLEQRLTRLFGATSVLSHSYPISKAPIGQQA